MFAFCLDLSPFLIQRHYVFHISCPSDHAAVLFLFFPSIAIPLEISNSRLKETGSQLLLSGLNLGIIALASNLCWRSEDENLAFCTVVNRGKIESL